MLGQKMACMLRPRAAIGQEEPRGNGTCRCHLQDVEALLSNVFCDSYFNVSFRSCSPVLSNYIIMSQIFEFDLVTAFNASSLNISEKDFKAANPNEFYLVSLVSVHGLMYLGGLALTYIGRRVGMDDDVQWPRPSHGSGAWSILLRNI
jgi:hypothetical protein